MKMMMYNVLNEVVIGVKFFYENNKFYIYLKREKIIKFFIFIKIFEFCVFIWMMYSLVMC